MSSVAAKTLVMISGTGGKGWGKRHILAQVQTFQVACARGCSSSLSEGLSAEIGGLLGVISQSPHF